MPRQPDVHFRLKPQEENGKCSIYLQFIYKGNRLFYSFGQVIDFSDWNPRKERVKKKDATTKDGKHSLNDLLENLKILCEKTYNESLKNGIPTPDQLRKPLDEFMNQNMSEPDPSKPTLFTLARRFIDGEIKNKGKKKSKGSLQNYATVSKHLKEFEIAKKYPVTFESINLDFFYKYTSYLSDEIEVENRKAVDGKKSLGLKPNSIAKDISILKVFMAEAVDLGYTSNMTFKHSKFSYSEVETDNVYLTEKEIIGLYNFDLSGNKKLEQVKDLFVFGAWVGLRFSDFSNVEPEHIVEIDGDRFIKMITTKTKELVIIPCNPIILDIFKKYEHNPNRLPDAISNQKFNDYIKEACKEAGMNEKGRLSTDPELELWQCIASHTARRSFATNYYLQGFPTIDLMKITGHKTEKSFLKYIRVSKLDTAKRLNAHIKKRWSEKMLRVA